MMDERLLLPPVQQFIKEHEQHDEQVLLLKSKTIHGIPASFVINQIVGRRKAKTKLPTYFNTPNILYPPAVSIEQSSSELTAHHKATIVAKLKCKTVVDLTGGFGVDSVYLSKICEHVHYVEPNVELSEIARYNFEKLMVQNITCHASTAENFLKENQLHPDIIYADPSRRISHSKKVFKLSESEPNIINLLDSLFQRTDRLLIKTSPLYDIRQGILELQTVSAIWVVSVENECKELLFLCSGPPARHGEITIQTINILKDHAWETFVFSLTEEKAAIVSFTSPETYLYEPNASILKGGAFKSIANQFNLKKLHPHTHLYTSKVFHSNFPGKIFANEKDIKPDPKIMSTFFPERKANITVRNYPLGVDALKKKTGLKEGGEKYLIGFSGMSKKHLIVASRLK